MNSRHLAVVAVLVALGSSAASAQPFPTPLYINMGGDEVVDSAGRTWLGDPGAGLDELGIRPNDAGGANVISPWCVPDPVALTALGFDPSNAADVHILSSMRWDNAGDTADYVLEIPVEPGVYNVSLYFCDPGATPSRHFKVLMQDQVVFPDVSSASYGGGLANTPGLQTAGDVLVGQNGILRVALLGCLDPECPGSTDQNPVLSALAVEPSDGDPCADAATRICPFTLTCAVNEGDNTVTGSWGGPACFPVTGYEVYENDVLVDNLAGDATSFTVPQTSRESTFRLVPAVADGDPCPERTCSVSNGTIPFPTPLHINLGGPEIVDSMGRTWLGDPGAGADVLNIRPDDGGGSNVIPAWCAPSDDSITALGFDPTHAPDVDIFRSIRWDAGADAIPYVLSIRVGTGFYDLSLYFCESCCANRHARVDVLGGQAGLPDVSVTSYAGGATQTPGVHELQNVFVPEGGLLRITLLGCLDPECPGGGDGNPTLTALAIEPSAGDPCAGGARICPFDFSCELNLADDMVTGTWEGPACFDVTGYEVVMNDVLLETLAADATSFTALQDVQNADYRVVPLVAGGEEPCAELTCSVFNPNIVFDTSIGIYFNMGGPERTDTFGRLWRGDEGVGLDPNGMRPDDAGGANVIPSWCNPSPESVAGVGFAGNPADIDILRSIRWDTGNDGIDYTLAFPLRPGLYDVELYFCEACCPQRHFKVDMQRTNVFPDVHSGLYAGGASHVPGLLRAEDIEVGGDQLLSISLLPCPDPECPGSGDINAILSALAITEDGFDPCSAFPAFRQCPSGLTCSVDKAGQVTGAWEPPRCIEPLGYDVFEDDALLASLPGDATGFSAAPTNRVTQYRVVPRLPEGEEACAEMSCIAVREDIAFEVPLRINLGGRRTVDSHGNLWFGDPGGTDRLSIRPNDAGGTNTIENWCPQLALTNADSLQSYGFDPNHPGDLHIMNTIRWDVADDDGDLMAGEAADVDGGDVDFHLEIPLDNGIYEVRVYSTECCCPGRHFSIEVQGVLALPDVHLGTYSRTGSLGRTGRAFTDLPVVDGFLRLGFLPCPDCPEATDPNAIMSAIEVLPMGAPSADCAQELSCQLGDDGKVDCEFTDGDEDIVAYTVLRNGVEIVELPADATTFTDDDPPCRRTLTYQVVPQFTGDSPCPGLDLVSTVIQPDCPFDPFEEPIYINSGGLQVRDSTGRLWLGDPGAGADVLNIRPNDAGGTHVAEYWSIAAFQPDSFDRLGLDGEHQSDVYVFNTIRWDPGADAIEYLFEVPVPDGTYDVNLYFNEGCCPERHFMIDVQGVTIDDDVSFRDYDTENPDLGRLGVIGTQATEVRGGVLRVALIGCLDPLCPGSIDNNAILDALEVTGVERFNTRPTAVIAASAKEVQLEGGVAEVTLDGSGSDDGDEGSQGLTFAWSKVRGPDGDTIASPGEATTTVSFTQEGAYLYQLDVDDGQAENNTHSARLEITVLPEPGVRFVRGDVDSVDGINLTDGIVILNFLFLGGPPPACIDAADTDDSGVLDITDGIIIFSWLFLGGDPPREPMPSATAYLPEDCGLDPTEDTIECETASMVCQ